MPDLAELRDLLERVAKADGPDRDLDISIWRAFHDTKPTRVPLPWLYCYTVDVKTVIATVKQTLPGWAWKIGTCSVSDDAWLAPDFNCPVHGDRLRAEFPNITAGSIWDAGVDIDRRPSGNPALALIEALLTALIAKAEASAVREGV